MADPRRFTNTGQGLDAELLRSAACDEPHPLAEDRLLAALGLAATTIGATAFAAAHTSAATAGATVDSSLTAASAVSGVTQAVSGLTVAGAVEATSALVPVVVKWVGGGLLAGAVATGSIAGLRHAGVLSGDRGAESSLRATAPPAQRVSRTMGVSGGPSSVTVASNMAKPASSPRATSRPANDRASALPEGSDQLSAEVRTLDRAAMALSTGEPERTLRELEQLERQFPRATLGPELSLLKMEALAEAGRPSEAAALARAFLARHAGSPHVTRVRALLTRLATRGDSTHPEAPTPGVARFSETR